MFKILESNLVLNDLSKKELAKKLGLGYNTLLLKMKGENNFTLDEAFKIKEIINTNESIEKLFSKSKKEGSICKKQQNT